MADPEVRIDEGLYSRQLYVSGLCGVGGGLPLVY